MPAIIINDNPDWNGGMVVSAGLNMIIGWKGPDTRLFENVLLFMLDGKTDTADDGSLDVIDNINTLIESVGLGTERPVDVLVYGYDEDGKGPISAGHLALLESRGYVVKGNNGPADADEMKDAKVVVGWEDRTPNR